MLAVGPAEAASVTEELRGICVRPGADVMHIETAAQLPRIKGQGGIFCIHPGDYRAAGRIRLPPSGLMENGPKALVFYHPSAAVADAHPVDRPSSQQAIIAGLDFEGGDDWMVHGLTIKPVLNDKSEAPLIRFHKGSGSTNNVLEQLLIEGGGGGAGQVFVSATNDNNVIRGSVLRETLSRPDRDFHCIKINDAEHIVVEKNEIYDCAGDAIQIDSGGAAGGVISDNDLYITPGMYTDCSGNKSATGQCACAENAIDLKGGGHASQGNSPPQVLEISNNRMWGYRKTDPLCGGTGDAGNAIAIHWEPADYVLIKRNLIARSDRGVNVTEFSRLNPLDGTQYVSILENIFYSISEQQEHAGRALVLKNASRYEVYGNLFIETDEYLGMGKEPGSWNEFACNFIFGSSRVVGKWGAGSTVLNNVYAGVARMSQDMTPLRISSRADEGLRWCVETQRIVAHEEICMQGIMDSDLAAWSGHCAARAPDNRKDVGVDDVPYALNLAGIRGIVHVRTE